MQVNVSDVQEFACDWSVQWGSVLEDLRRELSISVSMVTSV